MENPYLLHMFNPTNNVSPFDVNMAYEAGYDGVIPYSNVALEDVHSLTQDTIFSRTPAGVKRTSIFIGGREFGMAIDMLNRAKAAMLLPFAVSVFADPSGAITTAATLVACIEHWVKNKTATSIENKSVYIIGGTGPVGVCAGVIAANYGANVHLLSHRGAKVARELVSEYNGRFGVNMQGGDSSQASLTEILMNAEIIIGAAKAGVQLTSKTQLKNAHRLIVAADVNAVPPLGIQGVGSHDIGKVLDFTPNNAVGIGALAIGDIKYKVHQHIFQIMKTTEQPLYLDHNQVFTVAREHVAK